MKPSTKRTPSAKLTSAEEAKESARDSYVTGPFLAEVFGVTARTVQSLASDGVIPKIEHGRYPLTESVRAYIQYVKTGGGRGGGGDGDSDDPELTEEKTLLTRVKRRREELRLENDRNALVKVADVAAIVGEEYGRVRSRMLAVPTTTATRFAFETSPQVIQEEMTAEIAKALAELSEAEAVTAKSIERNRASTGLAAEPADDGPGDDEEQEAEVDIQEDDDE